MKHNYIKKAAGAVLAAAMAAGLCGSYAGAYNNYLSADSVSVAAGDTAAVTVGGSFDSLVWSSSDPTVATVSRDGVVKGVSAGKCSIYAVADGETMVCGVTVTSGKGKGITLSSSDISLNKGGSKKVTVTVSPKSKIKTVISNTNVIEVTRGKWNGNSFVYEITAKKDGTASVKVCLTDNPQVSAVINVTVGSGTAKTSYSAPSAGKNVSGRSRNPEDTCSAAYTDNYCWYSSVTKRYYMTKGAAEKASGGRSECVSRGRQDKNAPAPAASTASTSNSIANSKSYSSLYPWYSSVTGRYYKTKADAIRASGSESGISQGEATKKPASNTSSGSAAKPKSDGGSVSYSADYQYYSTLSRKYYKTYDDALKASGGMAGYVTQGEQSGKQTVSEKYLPTFPWYSSVTGVYYADYQDALDASGGDLGKVSVGEHK